MRPGDSRDYPFDDLGALPTSGRDQSCVFCGAANTAWVHKLDPARVRYRVYGKGHTLPHFWTLCDPCEEIYRSGDDDAAVACMLSDDNSEWSWDCTTDEDIEQQVRQPLKVFRRADLERRPLTP